MRKKMFGYALLANAAKSNPPLTNMITNPVRMYGASRR
jgi:hypothetical protein